MKYTDLKNKVFSIFSNPDWTSEGLVTIPDNIQRSIEGEYIQLFLIISGYSLPNDDSASGQLIIDIFIPAGNGPSRSYEIADKLDKYISRQTILDELSSIQFGRSTMNRGKLMEDGRYMYTYSVPFNLYFKR